VNFPKDKYCNVGLTGVVAVPDGEINPLDHGYTNFPKIQEPP